MTDLTSVIAQPDPRVTFLLARYEEDAAAATQRKALADVVPAHERAASQAMADAMRPVLATGRHEDPDHALADYRAKRRVVVLAMTLTADDFGGPESALAEDTADTLLRLLVSPYADHPDFRPEWSTR